MNSTPHSDIQLSTIIRELESAIMQWAQSHEIWYDCGFQTFAYRVDAEPQSPPVVTILHFEGAFGDMLDGSYAGLDEQFSDLLTQRGFWYERNDGVSIHIYPEDDNPLLEPFADYLRWQWICGLLQPDVADVYEEIYAHFARQPDDLHRLQWREFEILLFRVFQNQGFQAELGPGSGDGGVDIRLLQRDPIGDIMTLVQAKKYAPKRKIGLEAVAALHGVAEVERASRSLFVTTSSYQPAARTFAARTSGRLMLSTSEDVVRWCQQATQGVIQDKSSLVSPGHVENLVRKLYSRDPRVVQASVGVTMQLNSFALVLKETKYAALLMTLPRASTSPDGYGQVGWEVPQLDNNALQMLKAENVFRAKRSAESGRVSYWCGRHLYTPWRGEPEYYSYLD